MQLGQVTAKNPQLLIVNMASMPQVRCYHDNALFTNVSWGLSVQGLNCITRVCVVVQYISEVKDAIMKSGMNLNPQQEGTALFVPIPM